MNEIAKEYYSEVASRSITAKSAHAKNGNNADKLGNRQLTRKEIEEKHGPVKTYTFDDFLSFSEFREMPTDWQAAYINNLQDKYDIGLTQIGRDLFGLKNGTSLNNYIHRNLPEGMVTAPRNNGDTRSAEYKAKFERFRRDIAEWRKNKVCSEVANAVGLPEDIMKNAPEPTELKSQLDESIQKLNDRVEKGETITVNDVNKELGFEPVPEEKNEVIAKPPVFKTKQKVFSTCYIGDDFNMAEIEALRKMFAGQKIRIEITVTIDSLMEKYE